jgi:hypothetical protein
MASEAPPDVSGPRLSFSTLYWTWWGLTAAATFGFALFASEWKAMKEGTNMLRAIFIPAMSASIDGLVLAPVVALPLALLRNRAFGARGLPLYSYSVAFTVGVFVFFGLFAYGEVTGVY